MLSQELQYISKHMIERYSNRYRQHGVDIKTLGWGTTGQQSLRFSMTLSADTDLRNASLVDIGCGFGDYYRFLEDSGIFLSDYTGMDINPDLIGEATRIFNDKPNVRFRVANLLKNSPKDKDRFDIGIMLGLLNVHLKGTFNNYAYSKRMITNAFQMVKHLLIVDFISTQRTPDYPEEDFIFYHDPKIMLEFALTLSRNVALKHNYQPIPQKEFMLFLYKDHE